jgi:hypothetical protein
VLIVSGEYHGTIHRVETCEPNYSFCGHQHRTKTAAKQCARKFGEGFFNNTDRSIGRWMETVVVSGDDRCTSSHMDEKAPD